MIELADVKARLADVPGIDAMSMTIIAGRALFGIGAKIASVDQDASDAAIDYAIRHKFGGVQQPAPPRATVKETTMSVTGAANTGMTLKSMLAQRKQALADGHVKLEASFARLDQATEALNTLGDKVGAEADDLLATIGQFTNDLG